MNNFKAYSFSRLIAHSEMEFFFILGLINPDDFDENWNGTGHTVVGYLVMYKNHKLGKIENIVYFLSDYKNAFSDIKRYTHHFADLMTSAELLSYDIKFIFKETGVRGDSVGSPYIDFVKSIVGSDISNIVLNDIKV
ncbi:hypothetical protein [Lysinibacillus sp. 3P01SB]|uniref:hypothetical protein n=1 Tax=Lysinibacillus sp. 3P01SB TaxID=3132284 RepID=UPI0039A62978